MRFIILSVLALFLGGCVTDNYSTQINDYQAIEVPKPTKRYKKLTHNQLKNLKQIGIASYYGPRWHGRRTANGEILNLNELTAAHKTLPFNTIVKVTDLDTGRSIIVRINDRGPYISGRIIDLTDYAAKKLGILQKGIARVKLEVVG